MKKFLGLGLVLVASSAQAVELKFGDLNYFLPQGRKIVRADLNWQTEHQTNKTGATKERIKTEGAIVSTQFNYGHTDDVNFFIGLDYNYNVQVTPQGGSSFDKNGLYNPILGLNYRLYNQASTGFNADFGAIIRVPVEDEEIGKSSGSTKKDGNASKRGSLELNGRIGQKWNEANEVYAKAAFIYNQSGQQVQRNIGAGDVNADIGSSYDFLVAGYYQYRPVNEFMMTLGAEARRVGVAEGDVSDTSFSDFEVESHMDYKLTFVAKYLVTETFIARFNYAGTILKDYKMIGRAHV